MLSPVQASPRRLQWAATSAPASCTQPVQSWEAAAFRFGLSTILFLSCPPLCSPIGLELCRSSTGMCWDAWSAAQPSCSSGQGVLGCSSPILAPQLLPAH